MARTESIMDELVSPGEKLATEANQTLTIAAINGLIGMDGVGAAGKVSLDNASNWFQVPANGSVPTSAYTLIVSKEVANGTMRHSFSNSSSPSANFGNKWTADDYIVEMGANQFAFFNSSNVSDQVNYTTKII